MMNGIKIHIMDINELFFQKHDTSAGLPSKYYKSIIISYDENFDILGHIISDTGIFWYDNDKPEVILNNFIADRGFDLDMKNYYYFSNS